MTPRVPIALRPALLALAIFSGIFGVGRGTAAGRPRDQRAVPGAVRRRFPRTGLLSRPVLLAAGAVTAAVAVALHRSLRLLIIRLETEANGQ